MKVKWQSDAPNMELVIPKGQYLPYELPVATKEVLGGVKVDGDTINITSDGVISTQKVDLSGVATKVELEEVENKIPDISGLATKSELATVESKIPDTSGLATKIELGEVMTSIPDVSGFATKTELNTVKDSIPDTSGLATKVELTAVENKIPDVSNFATKDEIPNVSGLATKVELNEVAATIPNSDDLATKAELNAVQSSIPDTTGLATKVELSDVEAKIPDTSGLATKVELQTVESSIPSEYLKNASVADNKLTITKSSGDTIEFTGGGSGGGGVQLNYNIWSTSTFTEQDKEVIKSAIKFGTGFTIDRCQVIRIIGFGSRRIFIILRANGATDNHVIGYQVDIDADKNVTSSKFSTFIDYVLVGNNSAISGDIITSDNWESYIHLSTSEWTKADSNDDSNLYNAKQLWVIAMSSGSYYEGIFRFDYSDTTTVLGDCTNVNFRLDDTFPFSYDGNSLNTSGVIIAIYYKL